MKRVFLAVNFRQNIFIEQYIKDIQSKLLQEKINWVESKNIHLTLKFFGSMEEIQIENTKKALETALKDQAKLQISFNKLGIFGSKYQPRVLWMGIKDPKAIISLEQQIRKALIEIGIPYDRQNFVPHLTIGRIKQLKSKKYFQSVVNQYRDFDSGTVNINSIYLYQSILRPQGPIYKVLAEFKLK